MTNNEKRTARIVGALFLTAMVTYLLGASLTDSVLSKPDMLQAVAAGKNLVLGSVLLEMVNIVAIVGIGIMMFPVFKRYNEAMALGYVAFRVLEAAVLIVAALSPLVIITLSQELATASTGDVPTIQLFGTALIAVRANLTGLLATLFFSLGALIFYSLLFQSQLVPRFISVWGLIGVVLVLTWNFLEAFGQSISAGIIFGLPIILNEIFLGIWLILKGFNPATVAAAEPGRVAITKA